MLLPDLMEAEATAVQAAILWLAQTILESLVPAGELDAWILGVGLGGATGELKSEVERMETVVNSVKGRAVGNKPLARCLARVKELMYDADDVVDELDYFRLQHKVEGDMVAPGIGLESMESMVDGAEQEDASSNTVAMPAPTIELKGMFGDGADHTDASAPGNIGRKNRSMVWDFFRVLQEHPPRAKCIDCGAEVVLGHGTSVLRKHLNSARCQNAAIKKTANCPSYSSRFQHQVQGGKLAALSISSTPNRGRKNKSEARKYFDFAEPGKAKCKDCGVVLRFTHGTTVLHRHRESVKCKRKRAAIDETLNCPSADDDVQNGSIILTNGSEARKKMRTEGNVGTTAPPWDMAKFSKRIHEIALELRSIRGDLIEYLKDSIARFDPYQSNTISDTRVRTSGSLPGKVYGRDVEKQCIMSVIEAAKSDNITVLPIVGIAGVGKTTLAKLVYNDRLVKNQFERIWVWVSNIFDEVRLTREILDVLTLNSHEGSPRDRESYERVSNYTKLQEILRARMACQPKRFLLVLDDVNDCMDDSQWKDLLGALGSSCTKGNLIILTARNMTIAQKLGTVRPVKLGALEDDDFWLLFKSCVFGDNNYKEHLDIGRQIATELNGNPLAAVSAADMLREQPTLRHWKSIMKNGVWESLQFRGGIVTALKISYYQLPYTLQQCLLFCSIFPNGYLFHIDNLVYMWISSGYVKSIEVGQDYLNALVNSGFLEHAETKHSILHHQKYYVMCGMMHRFARLVSRTEFGTIDGLECQEVLPTVRHFSILTDSVYHKDEHGIILCNRKFEQKLKSVISSVRRLRTLIAIGHSDSSFLSFHTIMFGLVNGTHLRCLKLENKGSNETLPISLRKLYHLEVLDVGQPSIVDGMSDLVNMRNLVLSKGAWSACSPAWFSCLQTIHLEDWEGCETLPSLESLSSLTKFKLRNMPEVVELQIPSLEELVLLDMPKLDRCFFSSVRDLNSSLRVLEIRRCWVLKAFPLFERYENFEIEKSWLPNITELTIHECPHLTVSNPLPPSSRFCKLSIKKVSALPTMEGSSDMELRIGSSKLGERYSMGLTLDDNFLSFHNLRTITKLEIAECENLSSILLKGLRQLACLKRLKIWSCKNIFSSDVPSMHTHEDMADADFGTLPSLECLSIVDCDITGEWLSVMLQHVQALERLHLHSCKQVTGLSIEGKENSLSNLTSSSCASSQGNPYRDGASTRPCPSKLFRIPSYLILSLKKMEIISCKLTFQGNEEGISGFTSLEELRVVQCPELVSSLVQEGEIDDQANGRWLLPCSLGILYINDISLRMLRPCFPGDVTGLKVLEVLMISRLKSLQLHSCTALEKLSIINCKSLDALEGIQSLCSLRYLEVEACSGLPQCLESLSMQGYELCPRLESLWIDDKSFLTMPFCKHLTSLQCLQFSSREEDFLGDIDVAGLMGALQLLTSLQELRFYCCPKLSDLPVGLHSLRSLKRLEIFDCPNISRLPQRGLPPSLEELEVQRCSEELTMQCRMLVTSKLKVIIDGKYVD